MFIAELYNYVALFTHTLWRSATDLNSPSGIVWEGTVAKCMDYVHTLQYTTIAERRLTALLTEEVTTRSLLSFI